MKLAIFSDVHGNLQATKAIIDDINKSKFDEVICLGDIIGIGPKSKDTLELILNNNINIVLGNHDLYYKLGLEIDDEITGENEINHHHWVHDSIKPYISKDELNYTLTKEITFNGKRLIFQHYMLNENLEKAPYPFEVISIRNMQDLEKYCENMKCDYMFVGHEHRGFEVHNNNKHLICIGSSGCVRDNKTFYIIVDIKDDTVNIVKKEIEFDREGFIKDLKEYQYPDQEFIAKVLLGIENL